MWSDNKWYELVLFEHNPTKLVAQSAAFSPMSIYLYWIYKHLKAGDGGLKMLLNFLKLLATIIISKHYSTSIFWGLFSAADLFTFGGLNYRMKHIEDVTQCNSAAHLHLFNPASGNSVFFSSQQLPLGFPQNFERPHISTRATHEVDILLFEWHVSFAIAWISMKCGTYTHVPLSMNNLITFNLPPHVVVD